MDAILILIVLVLVIGFFRSVLGGGGGGGSSASTTSHHRSSDSDTDLGSTQYPFLDPKLLYRPPAGGTPPKVIDSIGEYGGYPTADRVRSLCGPDADAANAVIGRFAPSKESLQLITGEDLHLGVPGIHTPDEIYRYISETTGKPLETVLFESMTESLKDK